MLRLEPLSISTDPYLFGIAPNVLPPDQYAALVDAFPPESLFARMPIKSGYNKLSLSERNNSVFYAEYVRTLRVWCEFHAYIKSKVFVLQVFTALGTPHFKFSSIPVGFTSRFEFSSMPADGGYIAPHTDIPSKVITLVIPMCKDGDWQPEWGGGTDMLRPLDPAKPLMDYRAPLSEFEKVQTVPYLPNQCLVFVKTAASWHSVGPIAGPAGKWRRTVTINIEKVQ